MLKNWFFQIVVLQKTLGSPWDSKKVKLPNLKGNQPWIFIGRTDAEAEAPIHWSPDVKSQLSGKDADSGKYWGQEEKGVTEDEMVGWIIDSMDMSLNKFCEMVKDREAWLAAIHGVTKSWTQLSDLTRQYNLQKRKIIWICHKLSLDFTIFAIGALSFCL